LSGHRLGNRITGRSRIAFGIDVGLMIQGSPDVGINESGSRGVSQSHVDEEERQVRGELDDVGISPVLSASVVVRL